MTYMTGNAKLIAAAGLGLLAVIYVLQKKNLVAGAVAGAVGVAADTGAGLVLGVGDIFGVPRTNEAMCAQAQAEGSLWKQLNYCTAGENISSAWQTAQTAPVAVVNTVGDAIGLPRTNETECQKALREGRTWDASFACPAGTFLKSFF